MHRHADSMSVHPSATVHTDLRQVLWSARIGHHHLQGQPVAAAPVHSRTLSYSAGPTDHYGLSVGRGSAPAMGREEESVWMCVLVSNHLYMY